MLEHRRTTPRWMLVRLVLAACAGGAVCAWAWSVTHAHRMAARQPFVADAPLLARETADRLDADEFSPIEFATYDSLNQVTHPSAVVFEEPWHGYRYWLALTPYPYSDARMENPSLYVSHTGRDWSVPDGVTNPLLTPKNGYLSDPSLMYDPDADALRLYYREVVMMTDQGHSKLHLADDVLMTSSADGVIWDAPRPMVRDTNRYVVSPTVVRRAAGDWLMWQVDAGARGCDATTTRVVERLSRDGVAWSSPTPVRLVQPGQHVWHLEVQYVAPRHAYWALVAAYPAGSDCNGTSLFLATSYDGVSWTTYPSPVAAPGVAPQFGTNVYKSAFHVGPEGKELTIWLTGAKTVAKKTTKSDAVLEWSAALVRTRTDALLEHVASLRAEPGGGAKPPEFERELPLEIPMEDIII